MTDELLRWRAEFPILSESVYLISHSLGAMPCRARERLFEFADTWATRGIRAWEEGWWDLPVSVGNLLASIVDAGPGEVIIHQNVSMCQAIVHSCFDWTGRRNKIVSEALNFPTNLYLFQGLERAGARIQLVPSDDGIRTPLDRMLDAIDDQTQLVSISHVHFKSAFIQDVKTIAQRAHEVGAYILSDVYQATGTVPFSVRDLDVDFATGGSVKWLCGGPGAGYLYVRPDLWPRLEPKVTGWAAHANPFAFAAEMEYAPDVFRFGSGTPNIPALYSARSGYEIIREIGVEKIRAKSVRQTSMLIDKARETGFRLNCPVDAVERGGSVILDVANGKEITAELARRNILVDYRPGAGIRVAPHFYTTDEELMFFFDELVKLTAH